MIRWGLYVLEGNTRGEVPSYQVITVGDTHRCARPSNELCSEEPRHTSEEQQEVLIAGPYFPVSCHLVSGWQLSVAGG